MYNTMTYDHIYSFPPPIPHTCLPTYLLPLHIPSYNSRNPINAAHISVFMGIGPSTGLWEAYQWLDPQ